MMMLRSSNERGYEDKGWLQSYHTFSFENYYDQNFLGFRSLCVLNEDTIKGGKGFGFHTHKDMEVVTFMVEGALEHKDSLGNTSVIRPGEVQLISGGTGITHSEYNLSHHLPVHFLQMWFRPLQNGQTPSYGQKFFSTASRWGHWCLIASNNGREGSLRIHQDVDIYATLLDESDEVLFETFLDRYYWVQVISGSFTLQEMELNQGDGVSLVDEELISLQCIEAGEVLLIDLA